MNEPISGSLKLKLKVASKNRPDSAACGAPSAATNTGLNYLADRVDHRVRPWEALIAARLQTMVDFPPTLLIEYHSAHYFSSLGKHPGSLSDRRLLGRSMAITALAVAAIGLRLTNRHTPVAAVSSTRSEGAHCSANMLGAHSAGSQVTKRRQIPRRRSIPFGPLIAHVFPGRLQPKHRHQTDAGRARQHALSFRSCIIYCLAYALAALLASKSSSCRRATCNTRFVADSCIARLLIPPLRFAWHCPDAPTIRLLARPYCGRSDRAVPDGRVIPGCRSLD